MLCATSLKKCAAAYIIAAGFIIQISSAVFPGLGVAKLGIPLGRGVFTDRVSDIVDSRLGLRRDLARNSVNPTSSNRDASAAQYDI